MQFNVSTDIRLTPRAAAVARVTRFSDQLPRRFGMSCALGDTVSIQDSPVDLIVVSRQWAIRNDSETLVVLLDLLESPSIALAS